jgi:site-specific DNA-methyltransferase (adenine-specific)
VEARIGDASVSCADALDCYERWEAPTVIFSDGPYGIGGYPGDPKGVGELPDVYGPHVEAWSRLARPDTTLWFWGTELGWATVHPLLLAHGWEYRSLHVWDKGIAHVAGNVNSKTIRGFPVVTEACVRYTRVVRLPSASGEALTLQEWLRSEWERTGLPLSRANAACGVKNAATRKYLTRDGLWYFPPPETMEALAAYAAAHGTPTERPYLSLDGRTPLTAAQWEGMRSKWHHLHGTTNVWAHPAVRGGERLKETGALRVLHSCQKPLALSQMCVEAASDPGDVVWEPFGGLCTASLASLLCGRRAFAAEVVPEFHRLAVERLRSALEGEA